uniref:hypothetical protein n=1 Tax=Paraconexibacter sp. TaxID=2949640 RepID=UPI003565B1FD
ATALIGAGCGKENPSRKTLDKPQLGIGSTEKEAAEDLGFPGFATKNTTRVGGSDPAANAAAVARAVYPGDEPAQRPAAVALADGSDWRIALAASALMAPPLRAPVLLSDGEKAPAVTVEALRTLAPTGSKRTGGAQVVRVGDVFRPARLKTTDVTGANPFAVARALDAFGAAVRGSASNRVVVVSADAPGYAMPAASWSARSGDPILFVRKDVVPPETRAALKAHRKPQIYVLGPSKIVSPKVTRVLRTLGTVTRVGDQDIASNAVAFARFRDGEFGWGITDPGHGLVFASAARPADAAAAAPLSSSGTYGPLLVLPQAGRLPAAVQQYLLDVQPGYDLDPVRGVYNHGWIIGDAKAIDIGVQAKIDGLLEISPVNAAQEEEPTATTGGASAPKPSTTTTPKPDPSPTTTTRSAP